MFPKTTYCLVSTESVGDMKDFTVIAVDPSKARLERLKTALERRKSPYDDIVYEIRKTLVCDYIDYEYYRAITKTYCFVDLPEEYKWKGE
ncbi:MAG TPA: hypothetical protein P5539_11180 [Mesotoga sp.]|nr:hypothetical protein [Mesotoga sp.]